MWAWKKDYDKMTHNDIIKKLVDAGVYGGATVVSFDTVNENVTYKQDGIDTDSLDYALRFLNANQLYIFKAVMLQEKTLEEVAKEIGKSKESVGRTCQEVIKKIQQRFTVAQFKEIITLN